MSKKPTRETLVTKVILLIILATGLALRLYRIADNPPSLNWDEVSHGYNAFSILKTGRDEWGQIWPLIFRCFGDYKLPLYIYLSVLPVKVFGLTPLAVRLISTLAGTGLCFVAYLLAEKWFRKTSLALLVSFLVAFSPWTIFLSRVAVEANLAAFLFSLGIFFIPERLWLTAFAWGLSLHAYNSTRILVTLAIPLGIFYFVRKKQPSRLLMPLLILSVFLLPIAKQMFTESGRARFLWVTLLDQGAINQIVEKRISSDLPPVLARLFYNRPVYFLSNFIINIGKNLSPSFLFWQGGSHYQFSLPEHGLLYLVTAPFFILGLLWSLLKKPMLWLWMFLAIIPAAMTRDSPHVLRIILILPLPMILIGLGVKLVKDWLAKRSFFGGRLLLAVFIFSVTLSFLAWWRTYWQDYRLSYSWAWQYGDKEAIEYVQSQYGNFDRIVFTKKYGEPHEFILFWWQWSPESYQSDSNKKWDYHSRWYWIDSFDKFEFWNDWEIKEKLKTEKGHFLLVTSPGNYLEGGNLVKSTLFLDGSKAYDIIEYSQ